MCQQCKNEYPLDCNVILHPNISHKMLFHEHNYTIHNHLLCPDCDLLLIDIGTRNLSCSPMIVRCERCSQPILSKPSSPIWFPSTWFVPDTKISMDIMNDITFNLQQKKYLKEQAIKKPGLYPLIGGEAIAIKGEYTIICENN